MAIIDVRVINFHRTAAVYVEGILTHLDDDSSKLLDHLADVHNDGKKAKSAVFVHKYEFKDDNCKMAASANVPLYWCRELLEQLNHLSENVLGECHLKNLINRQNANQCI